MNSTFMKLNIATLNVRGARSQKFRLSVFNWAKVKNIDILFLQERFGQTIYVSKLNWNGLELRI